MTASPIPERSIVSQPSTITISNVEKTSSITKVDLPPADSKALTNLGKQTKSTEQILRNADKDLRQKQDLKTEKELAQYDAEGLPLLYVLSSFLTGIFTLPALEVVFSAVTAVIASICSLSKFIYFSATENSEKAHIEARKVFTEDFVKGFMPLMQKIDRSISETGKEVEKAGREFDQAKVKFDQAKARYEALLEQTRGEIDLQKLDLPSISLAGMSYMRFSEVVFEADGQGADKADELKEFLKNARESRPELYELLKKELSGSEIPISDNLKKSLGL